MLYDEYMQLPVKKHVKSPFTTQDDIRLVKIINENPSLDWEDIAAKMGDRNVRQCKERWENYLSPNINKSRFTHAEDVLLLKKLNQIGKKWRVISKSFDNRTDISLKSRFKVLSRKGITLENIHSFREAYQSDEDYDDECINDDLSFIKGKKNRTKKVITKGKKEKKIMKRKTQKKQKESNMNVLNKIEKMKSDIKVNETSSSCSPETNFIDLQVPSIESIFADDILESQLFSQIMNDESEIFPFFKL